MIGTMHLGYSRHIAPFEYGIEFGYGGKEFSTVDTEVQSETYGIRPSITYNMVLGVYDLRMSLIGILQFWRQHVERESVRKFMVSGVGTALGIRIPLFYNFFMEPMGEGALYFSEVQGKGQVTRATGGFMLSVGNLF